MVAQKYFEVVTNLTLLFSVWFQKNKMVTDKMPNLRVKMATTLEWPTMTLVADGGNLSRWFWYSDFKTCTVPRTEGNT